MKRFLVFLAAVLFVLPVFGKQIVIYHTSDTHGFFYPEEDLDTGRQWGGFAALKALVNKEKQPYLLLDGGDWSSGTAEVKNTKGRAAITMMNAVGYNAAAIGNHDNEFGNDNLLKNLKLFNFPVLNANIVDSRTSSLLSGTKPFEIFDVNGAKVAVIGLGIKDEYNNDHFKFKSYITALKETLPLVQKHNPDLIVLLIHDSCCDTRTPGRINNKVLAQKFPEINIILGGHYHKEYSEVIGKTLLVESGSRIKKVSKITVELDDKTASSVLIPLYIDETGEDAAVKKVADSARVPGLDDVIHGYADAYLSRFPTDDKCSDSPLDNWVADTVSKYTPEADVAMGNALVTRMSIPKGKITQRTMTEAFPFDIELMYVEVDGRWLKDFIRAGIKDGRSLFTYHGLTAGYNVKNKKIKDLEVYIKGKKVENWKKYIIATNEHIASGKTEGWMFKKIGAEKKRLVPAPGVREILIKEIQESGPLYPKEVCRLKQLN